MAKTKKQLENELQELKILLDKQNSILASTLQGNNTEIKNCESSNDIEVKMSRLIKVTSLYNGTLNLKTNKQSDATIFTFNFFGYEQPIYYSDLIKCINTQHRFFAEGFCYIEDPEVVKIHYLDKYYKNILSKDEILNFCDNSNEYIKEKYSNISKQQKSVVLDMVALKLNNNENIDRNKIDILAEIAGIDIYEFAKSLK